jgi:hypothetical protein
MIYEYAVSPGLFSNSKDVGFLLDSFGKGKGRLISKVPNKKWINMAFQEISRSSCGQMEKKKLKNAANKLFRHASYARPADQSGSPATTWIELALRANKMRPFRGILVEQCERNQDEILVNDLDLRDDPLWKVPPSVTVARDAVQMMNIVQPMLDSAKEVAFVDRNFNPGQERFVNVLLECIDRVSSKRHGPKVPKITYHLGDKNITDSFIQDKMGRYVNRIPADFVIEFTLRPWDEMHDRFILTDIGGVEFGVGLDESLGGGSKNVRIKIMPDDDYRAERAKVQQTKPVCFIAGRQ